MKRTYLFVVAVAAVSFCFASCDKAGIGNGGKKPLVTTKDSVSYIIGTDIGHSLMPIKNEISLDMVMQGIKDLLDSADLKISREKMSEIMQNFNMNMNKKMTSERKAIGEKNLAEGTKFLDDNKSKQGVVTTASGLQYTVLTEGKGPKPTATDVVKVNYKGTTLDGKEFDSSYKRGQPATFPLNSVIPGWTEALQLMNVGSKFKVLLPPSLAYGENGSGSVIGPNSVLIFEIELLDIVKKDSTATK